MRILLITPTMPVTTSGARTRVFNLMKRLATHHDVYLLTFVQPTEGDLISEVTKSCSDVRLLPFEGFQPLGKWQNRLKGWVELLCTSQPQYARTFPVSRMRQSLQNALLAWKPDVVVIEQLFLVELTKLIREVPVLLVEHNVESDIAKRAYKNAKNPMHRVRDWLAWRKLSGFERRWLHTFPHCIAVSDRDATLIRHISPTTTVHVVPNGVDMHAFEAPVDTARDHERLLFFGTLSYSPNIEAIRWYCEEVWPLVRQRRPQITLDIVGADLSPQVAALDGLPGVKLVGFVPDIRPSLWSATACVVPLLVGGGTRLKILEALAAGCPIISTTVGAEGLDLLDGKHLLIADSPEAFVAKTMTLMESPTLRKSLASEGKQVIARQYDWSMIAEKFEAALVDTVQQWPGGQRK